MREISSYEPITVYHYNYPDAFLLHPSTGTHTHTRTHAGGPYHHSLENHATNFAGKIGWHAMGCD